MKRLVQFLPGVSSNPIPDLLAHIFENLAADNAFDESNDNEAHDDEEEITPYRPIIPPRPSLMENILKDLWLRPP